MATGAELLLSDEPAAGMNEQETADLMKFIRELRDKGYTVFLIEHDMKLVMNLCDRIYVQNQGHFDCRRARRKRSSRTRRSSTPIWERRCNGMAKEVLRIEGLKVNYGSIKALKGIDLAVEEGQIVTLIGSNGAGKSTTMNTISGIVHAAEGKITFEGEDVTNKPSDVIVKEGRHSLAGRPPGLPAHERPARILRWARRRSRDKQKIRETLDVVYDLFPILKERSHQVAGTLSGGEQQMLAVGRAMNGACPAF